MRFHLLGKAEGVTESLDRAIMAPSLNTASSTMRMVGKYLRVVQWAGRCGRVVDCVRGPSDRRTHPNLALLVFTRTGLVRSLRQSVKAGSQHLACLARTLPHTFSRTHQS